MNEAFRLMCVLAHPDDETLGVGGSLACYAAQGVEIQLLTATRGERGWFGAQEDNPGMEALGRLREDELRCAAEKLGIRRVDFLGYVDGDLDQADPREASAAIADHLRRFRPQVVVTFGPDGVCGHPDHIAISQFTTAAAVLAADCNYHDPADRPPHQIAKLYYFVADQVLTALYYALFDEIRMDIDGVVRKPVAWQDWAITTVVDGGEHWRTVFEAVQCHRSQLKGYGDLSRLSAEQNHLLWGHVCYYRAFSQVNGGRQMENDLFAGLRERPTIGRKTE